jgi:hypothetical protein
MEMQPHPQQAGPKILSSLNVRKEVAISNLLNSLVCGKDNHFYLSTGERVKKGIDQHSPYMYIVLGKEETPRVRNFARKPATIHFKNNLSRMVWQIKPQ